MISPACLLGLLSSLAAVSTSSPAPEGVVTLSAVGVGEPAPHPSVLLKVTELMESSLRRSGIAAPPRATSRAAKWVELARTLYFELSFAASLRNAEAALSHYSTHPDELGNGSGLLDAHLYAALALLSQAKPREAEAHFGAVLIIRPDYRLSEAEFPPTALAAMERARARVVASPRASLTVSTSPAFAQLLVDGLSVGETPTTVERLPWGKHFVQVSKEGHRPQSAWVEVTASGAELSLTLPQNPIEALRSGLEAELKQGGRNEVPKLAASLAQQAGARAVLLLAVARVDGRFVVSGALVSSAGQATRAVTSVALDLFDAPPAIERLRQALAAPGVQQAPVVVPPPPSQALDFERHYLGLGPPPAGSNTGVVGSPVEPLPPPTPLWKRPWVWAIAGGVVAAGAGGTYLLTRPAPRKSGLAVNVVLPE